MWRWAQEVGRAVQMGAEEVETALTLLFKELGNEGLTGQHQEVSVSSDMATSI